MAQPPFPRRGPLVASLLPALVACSSSGALRAPVATLGVTAVDPQDTPPADPAADAAPRAPGSRTADAGGDGGGALWPSVAGRHTLGLSSGWAWYEADVELTGTSGPLDGANGQDDSGLDPRWGLALKYNYFLDEHVALGAIVEARSFDGGVVRPLGNEIDPDDYVSYHFILSSRYYSAPLAALPRVKWFGGLDLGYVPGIELDATVRYAPNVSEEVTLDGDEFFTLALVGGFSFWVGDWFGADASLELGAFYEWALDPTEDDITLTVPGSDVAGEVYPGGVIGFLGLTFYL